MEDHRKESLPPDEEQEEEFLKERMERWSSASQQSPFDRDPFQSGPRKNKIIAGLLSFLIPGTGQLYLGLMQRGMMIMLLLILNIFAIVFFSTSASTSIPLIVLFSLFVPVIYFYNIFDALQQTDKVNGQWNGVYTDPLSDVGEELRKPLKKLSRGSSLGYLLVIGGVFLFLVSSKPVWLNQIFDLLGSSIGAILLIVIGIFMFLKESTKRP
jgi:TM2 domain-containing membrane protein YozV